MQIMCETITSLNPSHWDAQGCAYIPEHKTDENMENPIIHSVYFKMTQGYDTKCHKNL